MTSLQIVLVAGGPRRARNDELRKILSLSPRSFRRHPGQPTEGRVPKGRMAPSLMMWHLARSAAAMLRGGRSGTTLPSQSPTFARRRLRRAADVRAPGWRRTPSRSPTFARRALDERRGARSQADPTIPLPTTSHPMPPRECTGRRTFADPRVRSPTTFPPTAQVRGAAGAAARTARTAAPSQRLPCPPGAPAAAPPAPHAEAKYRPRTTPSQNLT
mmetsp:Transcript_84095/g.271125  ORF Transcript_84095/g.271125 Transcript_84095/m.271125 type:complete len:216 (+) Transcript_84095:972-1619(+)